MTLVGRATEQRVIGEAVDAARGGAGRALALHGEPGVGKSALLAWVREQADGMLVLDARGVESESPLAYATLAQLVQPLHELIDELPAAQGAALRSALALGPPAPTQPLAVLAGTTGLLAAAAARRPVLAIVDDFHWVDAASAQALLFAARGLGHDPVAMLVAVRADGPATELAEDLPRLDVRGLPPGPALDLLQVAAGGDVPLAVAERIVEASGGNPLALTEAPRVLRSEQLAGQEPLDAPMPVGPRLELAFRRRADALPPATREALLLVAASDPGEGAVLARALEAAGSGQRALDPAEAAGLVLRSDGETRFRHPLVRSAVYYGAAPAARRRAHERLAAASADGDGRKPWHLAAAAVAPDEGIAAALEQAAQLDVVRAGYSAGWRALERAARLTPERQARWRRLLQAGQTAGLAGEVAAAASLLERALAEARDEIERAQVQRVRGTLEMMFGNDHAELHRMLVGEARRVEDIAPEIAAELLVQAAYAAVVSGPIEHTLAAARRACELVPDGSGVARLVAEATYGQALTLAGRGDLGGEIMDRLEPALTEVPYLSPALGFFTAAITMMTSLERYERVIPLTERCVSEARAAGAAAALHQALGSRHIVAFRIGDWDRARADAYESLGYGGAVRSNLAGYTAAFAAMVPAARGDEAECRRQVHAALAASERGRLPALAIYAGWPLGLLELGLGHVSAAVQALERVAATYEELGWGDPNVVRWMPDLVEAYVRVGEPDRALPVLERLEAAPATAWARAAAARSRALLEPDRDDAHLAGAIELARAARSPFDVGRAQLARGEALRRRRQRVDAREDLRAAIATFERLGARPWLERAQRELRATGESVSPRTRDRAEELTPQELQVALLAAEGVSNRDIAAQLFVSPKTVEYHLSKVFRKLAVRSRFGLATALRRAGAVAMQGPQSEAEPAPS